MFLPELVVRSRRVVTPRGTRPAAVHVRGGKIIGVVGIDEVPAGCAVDDAADAAVLPGLVDIHVNPSSGLARTTQAAAAGGITTIIAMPAAEVPSPDQCWVDVGFWAPVSSEGVSSFAFGRTLLVSDWGQTGVRLHSDTRMHVQPFGSTDTLASLFRARASGLPLTAGTSPRRLTIVDDMTARQDRELLWAALAGGVLQTIASDGSPMELGLSATWTEAHARGYSLDQMAQWMAQAPARLVCLDRKGAIDVGYDADLVIYDPDAELKAEVTPYLGRRLRGTVERTYLRGTRVYQNRTLFAAPCGKLLQRRQ